jgi:hypothetical protein
MKKIYLILVGLLIGFNSFSQMTESVAQIRDSCVEFSYKEESYNSEQTDLKKFIFILNLDVLSYYDLYDQYSTQLSIQNYKKSQDYLDKKNELIKLRNEVKNTNYYYDINFECSDYDLKNKKFVFKESAGWYYSKAFIQYEELLITRPVQIGLTYRKCPYKNCSDEIYYSFKITNLATAEKIENAKKSFNLSIMYLLRFKEAKTKWTDFGIYKVDKNYLVGNLSKIIFYDSETGEIFHTIVYSPLTGTSSKK